MDHLAMDDRIFYQTSALSLDELVYKENGFDRINGVAVKEEL